MTTTIRAMSAAVAIGVANPMASAIPALISVSAAYFVVAVGKY